MIVECPYLNHNQIVTSLQAMEARTPTAAIEPRGRDNHDFVLRTVQPALLGLADGSISTLAPLFAAAVATQESRVALLVGLSAAVGAAISMGVSEACPTTAASPAAATRCAEASSPDWAHSSGHAATRCRSSSPTTPPR